VSNIEWTIKSLQITIDNFVRLIKIVLLIVPEMLRVSIECEWRSLPVKGCKNNKNGLLLATTTTFTVFSNAKLTPLHTRAQLMLALMMRCEAVRN
jgi:hypothetical protein